MCLSLFATVVGFVSWEKCKPKRVIYSFFCSLQLFLSSYLCRKHSFIFLSTSLHPYAQRSNEVCVCDNAKVHSHYNYHFSMPNIKCSIINSSDSCYPLFFSHLISLPPHLVRWCKEALLVRIVFFFFTYFSCYTYLTHICHIALCMHDDGYAYFCLFVHSLEWFLLAFLVCHALKQLRMSTVLPTCKSFLYLFFLLYANAYSMSYTCSSSMLLFFVHMEYVSPFTICNEFDSIELYAWHML